ncbi:MAG: NAD(P)/FAD-dependent oxidoreductase [Pseudomonadota bacterium]
MISAATVFFTKNESVKRLWDDMLGPGFIKVPRISRIYYNRKFFHYPIRLFNTLVNLGVVESVLIVMSYIASFVSPSAEEKTFEQWVSNRFGRRLYRTFFKTYTEKVWGIPCSSIQSDWASQRIQGLSLKAAIVNALVGTTTSKTLIDEFDYPVLGPGMMWSAFKQGIENRGGTVLMACAVERIRHMDGRVMSLDYCHSGEALTRPIDCLISSAPITTLTTLLDPPPPGRVLEAAGRLSYRSFLIVILILREENLFPDQWIYVHSPEVNVGRIQNFKNWSPAMVPDPGTTSLGLEYFCTEGDSIWTMDDENLAAMAARELEVLGLSSAPLVTGSYVVRQANAYPVYDETYKENVGIIREYLAGFHNLQTVGRSGMHRYNNMDHSMITGIMAAQNITGAMHNIWEVNEEETYLEDGKRDLLESHLRRVFARLHKRAFAFATGITAGLCVFLATLFLVVKGGEPIGPNLSLLDQYFIGYSVTWTGSLVGAGYGFLTGFSAGWLLALLRNLLMIAHVNLLRTKADRIHVRDFLDYF